MTLSYEFTYRTATPADQEAINVLNAWAFPNDLSPATISAQPFPLDFDRTGLVVRQELKLGGERDVRGERVAGQERVISREQVVGAHSSYEFGQYPVPGTNIAASGLTWVGVRPQYRRRGIL